ncbi:MAG: DNA cytosine methyltransferase [Bacillota bacterium]
MNRPLYRVPSMAEIAALPWNSYTVVSTFSGCGGSSLGYRMAGFRVLWCNEFIPAARDTYRANAAPYTIVDGRDIRTVQPEDILTATGLKAGELDLFDGSPPCCSFSMAGKRAKGWGKQRTYSDGVQQRTDDLLLECARLLKALQPKTFVAENVAGLVRGVAKGYFLDILKELKACGYKVSARVLDASWLGVPQARQRLIFVGVREDLGIEPVHPKPLPYLYTIRDALPGLAGIGTAKGVVPADRPCPTILTHGNRFTQSERTAIDAPPVEPETDISRFAIGKEWDKMGKPGTQSDKYFQLVRPALDQPCPTVTATAGCGSAAGVCHPTERRKFSIAELKRLCGFPDDFVLTGTYAQQWERLGRAVPPVMMMHIAAAIRDNILAKIRRDNP